MRKLCHLSPSAFTFHLKKVLSLVPPRKPRHAAGSLRVIVFVAHISSIKKWPKCKIKRRGIVYREVVSRVPDSRWLLNKLVPCSHPGPIHIFLQGAWYAFQRILSLVIWFSLSLKPLKPQFNLTQVETGSAQVLVTTTRTILHKSINTIHLG